MIDPIFVQTGHPALGDMVRWGSRRHGVTISGGYDGLSFDFASAEDRVIFLLRFS